MKNKIEIQELGLRTLILGVFVFGGILIVGISVVSSTFWLTIVGLASIFIGIFIGMQGGAK